MRLFFEREAPKSNLRMPRPSVLPDRSDLSVSARYRGSRIGGDYYDFLPISDTRMVFLLSDVAGKRDQALHIAAAVQDRMHELAPELLSDPDANVSDGVTALVLELNRRQRRSKSARSDRPAARAVLPRYSRCSSVGRPAGILDCLGVKGTGGDRLRPPRVWSGSGTPKLTGAVFHLRPGHLPRSPRTCHKVQRAAVFVRTTILNRRLPRQP